MFSVHPPVFAKTMAEIHGEEGVRWVNRLPVWLGECASRWDLILERPFGNLSYNYVAPATTSDGTRLVLKTAPPNAELNREIDALIQFDGRGSVRLVDCDRSAGLVLLERLDPGRMLSTVEDDAEATNITAEVMQNLWQSEPKTGDFPTAALWTQALARLREMFDGGTGPLPSAMFEKAERLRQELLESAPEPVLLHGDLHHFNILSSNRAPWLAIDPKGVIGEPAMETAAFLRNPRLETTETIHRRIDQFVAALNLNRDRVLGWAFVMGIVSACWTLEDHGNGWEEAIEFASRL